MSLEINSVEFGEFILDVKERVLLRQGKPVSITPKTFQLLLVLIENHGHIVEKNELMKMVWADSFVEDGNLTFTISLLRKALEDNKKNPRFIETVSRRGYRFIGEVRETSNEDVSNNDAESALPQPIERKSAHLQKLIKFLVPTATILVISLAALGFWYVSNKNGEASVALISAPFSSEKLSTNGKVGQAVISPDGKNVVYTNGLGSDKLSIWLRQLESANNVEIIPPSEHIYGGLAFSPDSNFLYFSRRPKSVEGQLEIYRVSIFGGVPTKIVSETQGWISISPDGDKLSFVRCYYLEDENCSLWIADSIDGRNEKKLASRPRPLRIGGNEFSPDGKMIAFAVGQSINQANEFGLVEVDIESGTERELTTEKFFNIKSLTWLPARHGLLVTASRIPNKSFHIWQISATGEAVPLTKDSENYSALSLDKAAKLLVTTQVKADFRLQLSNMDNLSAAPLVLADALSVAFAPDGKIVFSSSMTGNDEIWSINADGSERRQLTSDPADESSPLVSPKNNSMFFTSNRTGEAHIWRMNMDGSNQTQITKKTGGFPLTVSPDGKWLYYHSGRERTLWRVSTQSGEEQLVLNQRKNRFAISPDGLQVAYPEKRGEEVILMINSLADGQTIKTFHLADKQAKFLELVWTKNGKNLAYILVNGNSKNNTLWFQPLDGKMPRQIADLGEEVIYEQMGFALSPDGKSFAVVQGGWKHDAVLLNGLK